ncbi:MAG: hypothetical protein Q8O31_01480 [Rhodocyclaceae bacterium]|nr:hypothetical protein [Rhodocyclaceae bacterium]
MIAHLQQLEEKCITSLSKATPVSLVPLLVLTWVLMIGLLAGSWIMPNWREWMSANADRSLLEAQALPSSALGDPARLRAEITALEQRLADVPTGLTGGAVAMERIGQSAATAGLLGVEVRLIETGSKGGERGISIEAVGSYAQLGSWLERFPDELPWILLNRIEFLRGNSATASPEVSLKLRGVLLSTPSPTPLSSKTP